MNFMDLEKQNNIFRQALGEDSDFLPECENYDPAPNWNKMQARLSGQKSSRIAPLIYWLAAASVLIAILWIGLMKQPESTPSLANGKPDMEKPLQEEKTTEEKVTNSYALEGDLPKENNREALSGTIFLKEANNIPTLEEKRPVSDATQKVGTNGLQPIAFTNPVILSQQESEYLPVAAPVDSVSLKAVIASNPVVKPKRAVVHFNQLHPQTSLPHSFVKGKKLHEVSEPLTQSSQSPDRGVKLKIVFTPQ